MEIIYIPRDQTASLEAELRTRYTYANDRLEIFKVMEKMQVGDISLFGMENYENLDKGGRDKIVSRVRGQIGKTARDLGWPILPSGRCSYETGIIKREGNKYYIWLRRKPGTNSDGTKTINQ